MIGTTFITTDSIEVEFTLNCHLAPPHLIQSGNIILITVGCRDFGGLARELKFIKGQKYFWKQAPYGTARLPKFPVTFTSVVSELILAKMWQGGYHNLNLTCDGFFLSSRSSISS